MSTNKEIVLCHECGIEIENGISYTEASHGFIICEGCFDSYYTTCEECGSIYHYDDLTPTDYGTVCGDCLSYYITCDYCDCYAPDNVAISIELYNGDRLSFCSYECMDELVSSCQECSDYFYINDLDYEGRCSECSHSYNLQPYSTRLNIACCKVRENWKTNLIDNSSHLLGVELETDIAECDIDNTLTDLAVYQINIAGENIFLTKRDGSLASGGIETIFQPMDLKSFKTSWFKDLFESQVRYAYSEVKYAGIHISLSAKKFSAYEKIFLQYFIAHSANKLKYIANRGGGEFNKYSYNLDADEKDELSIAKYSAIRFDDSRIELRIFKGTHSYKTFLSYVEFCDAVARWVKSLNLNVSKLYNKYIFDISLEDLWDHFGTFLIKHKHNYINLLYRIYSNTYTCVLENHVHCNRVIDWVFSNIPEDHRYKQHNTYYSRAIQRALAQKNKATSSNNERQV